MEKKISNKYHRLIIHTLAKRFNIESKTEMIIENSNDNSDGINKFQENIRENEFKITFRKNESTRIPILMLNHFVTNKELPTKDDNSKIEDNLAQISREKSTEIEKIPEINTKNNKVLF